MGSEGAFIAMGVSPETKKQSTSPQSTVNRGGKGGKSKKRKEWKMGNRHGKQGGKEEARKLYNKNTRTLIPSSIKQMRKMGKDQVKKKRTSDRREIQKGIKSI